MRELQDDEAKLSDEQEKLKAILAAQQDELSRLEAELESHLQRLTTQADELRSRSEHIEHLKLMVDKYRHMLFGAKSEKIVLQIEQLELELEEDEATQAEGEAIAEQVAPSKEPRHGQSASLCPALAPRSADTYPERPLLSGLRRATAGVWRRRLRTAGVHSRELQGDPSRAA